MTTPTTTSDLPVGYRDWIAAWAVWRDARVAAGLLSRTVRPAGIPQTPSAMADEVVGYWLTPDGSVVEVSAVTFADLRPGRVRPRRTRRHIGLTWPGPAGERRAELVSTFAELDDVLGTALP